MADYTPYTFYNPTTGQPFPVYARSVAATARPTRNLDTFDPERKQDYESFNFEGRWRIPGGGQISGGVAFERERHKNCTAPDDPNYLTATAGVFNGAALCDDFALDIPYRPQLKLSGTKEIGWGINVSMAFQNNSSPTSSRLMTVTRGTTRYPANCPAPCPAGQIIMPTGSLRPDDDDHTARIAARHRRSSASSSSTSRCRARSASAAISMLPTFEVFNVNNSDAIISYVSTNVLSASLPGAEQHHAGPDVWLRRGDALVTRLEGCAVPLGGGSEGSAPFFVKLRLTVTVELAVASCSYFFRAIRAWSRLVRASAKSGRSCNARSKCVRASRHAPL